MDNLNERACNNALYAKRLIIRTEDDPKAITTQKPNLVASLDIAPKRVKSKKKSDDLPPVCEDDADDVFSFVGALSTID